MFCLEIFFGRGGRQQRGLLDCLDYWIFVLEMREETFFKSIIPHSLKLMREGGFEPP